MKPFRGKLPPDFKFDRNDANVLIYLLSTDTSKADRSESLPRNGGVISVQVLNKVTNVARRKLGMPWLEINEFFTLVRSVCTTEPVNVLCKVSFYILRATQTKN